MPGYALEHRTRCDRTPTSGKRYSIGVFFQFKKEFEAEYDDMIHEYLKCNDSYELRKASVCCGPGAE